MCHWYDCLYDCLPDCLKSHSSQQSTATNSVLLSIIKPKKRLFYLYATVTHDGGTPIPETEKQQRYSEVKARANCVRTYANTSNFDVELLPLDLSDLSILAPSDTHSPPAVIPVQGNSASSSPKRPQSGSFHRMQSFSQRSAATAASSQHSPISGIPHALSSSSNSYGNLSNLDASLLETDNNNAELTALLNPAAHLAPNQLAQYTEFEQHFQRVLAAGKMSPQFYQAMQSLSSTDEIIFDPAVPHDCIGPVTGIYLDANRIPNRSPCLRMTALAQFLYFLAPERWERLIQNRRRVKLIYLGHGGQTYLATFPSFEVDIQAAMDQFLVEGVVQVERRPGYHLATAVSIPQLTQKQQYNPRNSMPL